MPVPLGNTIPDVTCKLLRQNPHSIWDDPSMVLSIVTVYVQNLLAEPCTRLRRGSWAMAGTDASITGSNSFRSRVNSPCGVVTSLATALTLRRSSYAAYSAPILARLAVK
jgi:hypothetical protein